MVKKVSQTMKICHFLISKIFLTDILTARLLLSTTQQLHPIRPRPPLSMSFEMGETQKKRRKGEYY
jgi:hypothetical protein